MTDLKNNLEQVWKEEARKAYQDQQSQDNEGGCREPFGFVQGYLAAKKSDLEEIERLKRNPSDFMLKCGECGNVVVWYEQYTYQVVIAEKEQEIKTLKEQLAEFVKLAKLGVYSVEGLLTHNHESWELSTESWLLKTKTPIEKQDKDKQGRRVV